MKSYRYRMGTLVVHGVIAAVGLCIMAPAFAQQPSVEELLKQIQDLRKRVEELEKSKEDIPKIKESTAKLEKSAKDMEKKAKELQISGDVRYRFDEQENVPGAPSNDRLRERFRLRIFGKKKIDDNLDFGMMLATNPGDPISDNQTLALENNDQAIGVNQAYVGWSPNHKRSRIEAGVIPNPFMATDMVWDSDLNFPGIGISHKLKKSSRESPGEIKAVLGHFVVDERSTTAEGRLTSIQLQAKDFVKGLSGAIAYNNYNSIERFASSSSASDPVRGNTTVAATYDVNGDGKVDGKDKLFATGFAPLDLLVSYDFPTDEGATPINLALDYVNNTATNTLDSGWRAIATVGAKPARKGDWQARLYYTDTEADATLAAFSDSDWEAFGTGKGTNIKGAKFSLPYMLSDRVGTEFTWFHTRDEDGASGLGARDRFFLDFSTKF